MELYLKKSQGKDLVNQRTASFSSDDDYIDEVEACDNCVAVVENMNHDDVLELQQRTLDQLCSGHCSYSHRCQYTH